MSLDIQLDPDTEEIILVVDDHRVLKASRGDSPTDLILCNNFKELEGDDDHLYKVLRGVVIKLFALID